MAGEEPQEISNAPSEKDTLMFTTRMRASGFKETLRAAPSDYELSCAGPAGLAGFSLVHVLLEPEPSWKQGFS
jgi:hypothetical protein